MEEKLTTRILNRLGLQRKPLPAPDLGQHNYSPAPYHRGWWGRYPNRIDHKHEVGDLDLNSLAMAVVNYTATRIPEAKPCVVTRNEDGDEERDFTHPMAQLVRRPNRHHIWANYAAACSMSWWFNGNVYFYKVRSLTAVEELWYLPHFLAQPRWPNDGRTPEVPVDGNTDPFLSHYQYNPPGKAPVLYPAQDIIHLKRGVDLNNPRLGLGAFESLYKELYGDDRMALYAAAIMANMGLQVPIFSPKEANDTIEELEAAHMKETWMAKTTGDRAGEPVVMTAPVDIEKFGFNPSELDLSALRLIPESRVAAVTGIPAATLQFMVGLQNGTSYASSEQSRQQGYEEVIIPMQSVWAEELNWQLLPEFGEPEGTEFEFDTTAVRVLQEDRDAKYKRTVEAFRGGITTLNEARASLDKPNLGPEGDIYMVPTTASPTNLEQLIAKSDGSLAPEPVAPVDPEAVAKFMDIDRMLAGLEEQMRNFEVTK